MSATFILFIAGEDHPLSKKALHNVKKTFTNGDHELMVIDITKNPHVAESTGIIATPLLMRTSPPPTMRFVGDFSDSVQDIFI